MAASSPQSPGVLVVDDDHYVVVMVQMALERHGFKVWTASNGAEAIECYRQRQGNIAAVVLDMGLPVLDGPKTLDALRELDPGVVVCIVTGNTTRYDPDELLERGAAHVIAKPFALSSFADLLHTLVRERRTG